MAWIKKSDSICIVFGNQYYINNKVYDLVQKFDSILIIYYIGNINYSKNFARLLASINSVCFFGDLNRLFVQPIDLSMNDYTVHVALSGKKYIVNIASYSSNNYNIKDYIKFMHTFMKTEVNLYVIKYYLSNKYFISCIIILFVITYFIFTVFGSIDMYRKQELIKIVI